MKFSVGYQYPDEYSEERFPEIVQDYSDSIAELYFAPGNEPGARSPAAKASGLEEAEAWEILTGDLIETRKMGSEPCRTHQVRPRKPYRRKNERSHGCK